MRLPLSIDAPSSTDRCAFLYRSLRLPLSIDAPSSIDRCARQRSRLNAPAAVLGSAPKSGDIRRWAPAQQRTVAPPPAPATRGSDRAAVPCPLRWDKGWMQRQGGGGMPAPVRSGWIRDGCSDEAHRARRRPPRHRHRQRRRAARQRAGVPLSASVPPAEINVSEEVHARRRRARPKRSYGGLSGCTARRHWASASNSRAASC